MAENGTPDKAEERVRFAAGAAWLTKRTRKKCLTENLRRHWQTDFEGDPVDCHCCQ